jgi:hypothetical protein
MKRGFISLIAAACACAAAGLGAQAQVPDPVSAALHLAFDLAGDHAQVSQRFEMESRLAMHAPDGAVASVDVYRLSLECSPAKIAGTDGDRYTCRRFTVQLGSAPEVSIPSLEGWSYIYRHEAGVADQDGLTLGIPHRPFEELTDKDGKALPPGNAYHVYNAFIDFHSFFFLASRNGRGPGIQDLTRIGQRIVRAPAGSTASTSLEGVTGKGSSFRNGEISLELKGLGLVGERACAIVGFDSGDSSFTMIMNPMPNLEVRTVGSSHYRGDISLDLVSLWIRKATMTEMVVSETTVPGMDSKIHGVIERTIKLRNATSEN